MQIHQLVAGFSKGDAISNEACMLQKIFQDWGHDSLIFSDPQHIGPENRSLCQDFAHHSQYSSPENILLYHFSIGSRITDYFTRIPDKRIMIYHNITPAKYFQAVNDQKALVLRQGRSELVKLKDIPDLALGDSAFNTEELTQLGFANSGVLPLLMDWDLLQSPPSKSILKRYKDSCVNFLFVGRIVPNKKLEDLIWFFFYYQKYVNPLSRLFLVGSYTGMEKYYAYLRSLAMDLDLVNLVFTGHVSHEDLLAYYRCSDQFICMSEHEGFCIPLVEAMYFDLPVLAYNATAVPETMGSSGILFDQKDYPLWTHMAHRVYQDKALRKAVVTRQRKRIQELDPARIQETLRGYLEPYMK